MKYMLDTNICIYLMNGRDDKLAQRFSRINSEDICISNITYSELMYGVEKSDKRELNFTRLLLFLSEVDILNYDLKASEEYGLIKANLQKKGNLIGPNDMLIAAHCKSHNLTLITNNAKGFKRINGLKVENWVNKND